MVWCDYKFTLISKEGVKNLLTLGKQGADRDTLRGSSTGTGVHRDRREPQTATGTMIK